MKVIILCGGKGTRLREETEFKPKPMVEIGGRPVLWHIHKDFVLPLGYKGEVIKQYFHDYRMRNADFTVDLATGSTTYHPTAQVTDWRVTMSDTGPETLKGARIKRIAQHIDTDRFMVTYGDGVSSILANWSISISNPARWRPSPASGCLPASVPSRPTRTATSCLGRKNPFWMNTSTAGSSCSSANFLTISPKTSPVISRRSRSNALPPKASFPCTATPVSGSAWILREKWKN